MVNIRDRKSLGSCRKHSRSCSDDWHRRSVWSAFRYFETHFTENVRIFMNDGPNQPTWDAQMFSYWFSWNPAICQNYLVNLINNLRGCHGFCRPGRGEPQVENSPRLNWQPTFWRWRTTVHVPLFLSEWRDLPSAPNLKGKNPWLQPASPCRWNRAHRITCFLSATVTRKD